MDDVQPRRSHVGCGDRHRLAKRCGQVGEVCAQLLNPVVEPVGQASVIEANSDLDRVRAFVVRADALAEQRDVEEQGPFCGPSSDEPNEPLNIGREWSVFAIPVDVLDVQHCIPTQVRQEYRSR